MKSFSPTVLITLVITSQAFAGVDVSRGRALFNDPMLSGSSFGVSCNSCHPKGRGLENAGAEGKKKWKSCSGEKSSLIEAINTCIVTANKGTPINPESREMKYLVEYIKSLAEKH